MRQAIADMFGTQSVQHSRFSRKRRNLKDAKARARAERAAARAAAAESDRNDRYNLLRKEYDKLENGSVHASCSMNCIIAFSPNSACTRGSYLFSIVIRLVFQDLPSWPGCLDAHSAAAISIVSPSFEAQKQSLPSPFTVPKFAQSLHCALRHQS